MSHTRSSRARSSQQPPTDSPANSSSASSSITLKDMKTSKAAENIRSESQGRASVQRSESSSELGTASRADASTRRSRRGADSDKDVSSKQNSHEEEDTEAIEDDITRCVCGHADYPGPSITIRDKYGPDAITEDMGNFFVQCDHCHVWQHGGCMGLHDESIIPEEYYCEKCKPEYHKILKASSISTKSSKYLPILEGTALPSTSGTQAKTKEAKNKMLLNSRRRATMNSRGAYDEDEALRQAIEESKHDGTLGKRNRDDSEDRRPVSKRQRTSPSHSASSSKKSQSPDPDRIVLGKNGTKLRGAAARNNREKEIRDKAKQDTAAQRAEAATKRNARSERRRVDESPPPTPTISPAKLNEPRSGKTRVESTQTTKGKGKVAVKGGPRSKKVGRNQYTKDYDVGNGRDARDANGYLSQFGINGESSRSKAKVHPARTSMNEMKKRVAALVEFVSQLQSQQNKSHPNSNSGGNSRSSNSGKGSSTPNGTQITSMPSSKLVEAVTAGLQESEDSSGKLNFMETMEFNKLGSSEMMETLMKELVAWQSQFGVYSR